jgi:hypothetical protein
MLIHLRLSLRARPHLLSTGKSALSTRADFMIASIAVAYPAFFKTSPTVTSSVVNGTRLFPRIRVCPPCNPVIRQHREGAQTVALA